MLNRLCHFIAYAIFAVAGAGTCAAGATVLTLDVPHNMPVWLWNLTFTLMMFVGLVLFVYSVLRCCDEAFLDRSNPRRITGKR